MRFLHLSAMIAAEAGGNIIKNVKSVAVPNTGGRRGIAGRYRHGLAGSYYRCTGF